MTLVYVLPSRVALQVPLCSVAVAEVLNVKVPEVAPSAISAWAGMVTVLRVSLKVTATPPAGAAADKKM
jgi:hypothetical protein